MTDGSRRMMMPSSARLAVSLAALIVLAATAAQEGVDVAASVSMAGDRVPLRTVVPEYPERARRARVEGEVEVCFNVDRKGRTHRVTVRRSTNRVFEKSAKQAVRSSTYEPLTEDQTLSGIKTCRTFRFFLTPVAIEAVDG